ncbi:hypothetical protein EDB85DRAFT_1886742 [Lactarius pseudohatsudake]|nr:hypothetical protein EDB85DRAFT_1886742 [Lactarius pseudohatsudake]
MSGGSPFIFTYVRSSASCSAPTQSHPRSSPLHRLFSNLLLLPHLCGDGRRMGNPTWFSISTDSKNSIMVQRILHPRLNTLPAISKNPVLEDIPRSVKIEKRKVAGASDKSQKLRIKHWKECHVNIPLQLHSGSQLCNAKKTRNYIVLGLQGDSQQVKLSVQNLIKFLLAKITRHQTGHGMGNKGHRGRGEKREDDLVAGAIM